MSEPTSKISEELRERLHVLSDFENMGHPGRSTQINRETPSLKSVNEPALKKQVRFSSEIDSQTAIRNTSFSLQYPKKQRKQDPKNKVIANKWLELIRKKNHSELVQVLFSDYHLNAKTMEDFFRQEGASLLIHAVLWSDIDALQFIRKYVSTGVLKEVLRQKDYSLLNSFLVGYTFLEKKGEMNLDMLEKDIEKFKLLLEVDLEGISNYVESTHFESDFSEIVKKRFRQAVSEYRSQQFLLNKPK